MQRKTRRGGNWNRDMNGRPVNRAKSWGERKDKDPKKIRRDWKKGVTFENGY